jgi:hypothetical protein
MKILNHIDDIGIALFFRPGLYLARLKLLYWFDDMGIVLVCKPLGYLHRFAKVILDADERR